MKVHITPTDSPFCKGFNDLCLDEISYACLDASTELVTHDGCVDIRMADSELASLAHRILDYLQDKDISPESYEEESFERLCKNCGTTLYLDVWYSLGEDCYYIGYFCAACNEIHSRMVETYGGKEAAEAHLYRVKNPPNLAMDPTFNGDGVTD